MGKRFRTLPSLLWESDEEDGRSLHEAWSSVRAVQACVCKTALAAEVAKTKQLEQDLQTLRLVIQELQQKLKKTEFPVLPRLVVSKPSLSSASRGNPWYWLAHLPKGVQDLPRLREEIIPDLQSSGFGSSRITFDVCEWKVASDLLDHCMLSVQSVFSKYPAVYKVGITRNPVLRWCQGYAKDPHMQWTEMRMLALTPDPLSAGLIESSLIRCFQKSPGNQNIRSGGEGVDPEGQGPFFVYVVFRCLVPPQRAPTSRKGK